MGDAGNLKKYLLVNRQMGGAEAEDVQSQWSHPNEYFDQSYKLYHGEQKTKEEGENGKENQFSQSQGQSQYSQSQSQSQSQGGYTQSQGYTQTQGQGYSQQSRSGGGMELDS